MIFEGRFEVAAPLDRVWTFFNDPAAAGACIPGLESLTPEGPDTVRVTVKVKVSYIEATYGLRVTVIERRAPTFLTSKVEGADLGWLSLVKQRNTLELRPLDASRTEVSYRTEVTLFGKLGMLGYPIIQSKARQLMEAFNKAAAARMEAAQTNDSGTPSS